jgi:nucleoside-diphosphate-sugar epimerase
MAERQWLNSGLPAHIFRLAGIYGPGRSALDDVRAGTAKRINKPGQFFSRIHVEDIAQVLMASMNRPNPGAIYNVADDEPAPSHEVVAYACQLVGRETPPLVDHTQVQLSPMAQSFYADNKKVSNKKLKNELGVKLLYPTYREGLQACHTPDA